MIFVWDRKVEDFDLKEPWKTFFDPRFARAMAKSAENPGVPLGSRGSRMFELASPAV
jgi:hypothetical protein